MGLFSRAMTGRGQSRQSTWKLRAVRVTLACEPLEDRLLLAFDPSPMEQAFMESINRLRLFPQNELEVFFSSTSPRLVARDPSIQAAVDFFHVDRDLLLDQFSQLTPVAPLAWNEDLIDAALAHNLEMKRQDEQSHQLPGEPDLGTRVRNEGYPMRRATENVYAFAENHLHGHAGFAVDWGDGPGGIQDPAGHRVNFMDSEVREVGISVITDNDPLTSVGPYLVTQDFGRRTGYQPQLLGVVYDDFNQNGIYDPGEGQGGVEITIQGSVGTFTTTTMNAGGYQLVVPLGTYHVTATMAGGLATTVSDVSLGTQNRKVDFEVNQTVSQPVAVNDSASVMSGSTVVIAVLNNDSTPSGQLLPSSLLVVTPPNHGSATVNGAGQIVYESTIGFTGPDALSYSVRNSDGVNSNLATVSISVLPSTNRPPVATPDIFATVDGAVQLLPVLTNDFDLDGDMPSATIEIVSSPLRGAAEVVGGTIRYVPATTTIGLDTLRYQVSDGRGGVSNPVTVTIFQVTSMAAWQNPVNRLDVNGDGTVSPIDALLIINLIGQPLSYPTSIVGLELGPPPFVDVDSDNKVSPLDAILVINELNDRSQASLSEVAVPPTDAPRTELFRPRGLTLVGASRFRAPRPVV